MLEPGTILFRQMQRGEFQLPTSFEILKELKVLIEHLNVQRSCIFRSNHASNYLPIKGTLPNDKKDILKLINTILERKDERYLRPDFLRGL